ncbi:hypothetical protein SAMN04488104_101622 [Algoriphagus faecimaris]|uniref:DEAD/DEAH-box helicase domain-containing protein n=1 Tax=Algoriphagus faecimaris TaxID=686796 RepID=A0A1G6SBV2_9BACT|nr:DEAD/DEAH box helicase [Algoriphagus faecimaris]SDD13686.1 hypothetical protein SAMN04488104_101622 [Algoriphagus faecimaris]
MSVIKIELTQGQTLSDYKDDHFDFKKNGLPTGIIDKKYTGIGATHCEIVSKRNSIIVSPTRSLARSKYEEWVKKEKEKGISCFYLGGGFGKIKDEEITKFNSGNGFKKVFSVADSFPKIVKALGDSVYKDYAIIIDEIDSFQQDTSYRTSLESVVDYFWNFSNKTVVTATLIEFSDPRFKPKKDFPLFEVHLDDYVKKPLNVFLVENQVLATANYINQLYIQDNNKKIFIALNSVSHINRVIKTLLEDERYQLEDFGVLCSVSSREKLMKGLSWEKIENGKLSKQITFATSAYFVGVDIKEQVHLIVCNADDMRYSILFPEKILQIIGRIRVKPHSLSLISFRKLANPWIKSQFPFINKKQFLEKFGDIKNDLEIQARALAGLKNKNLKESIVNGLLETEVEGIKGLLRLDSASQVVVSDFSVDYLLYDSKRAREYENGIKSLLDYLSQYFEIKKGEIFTSQFEELSKLNAKDQVEAFLSSYDSRILRTSGFFDGANYSLLALYEAEANLKDRATASLLLQSIYFSYLDGNDWKNSLREYNEKAIQIIKFGRILLFYKLRNSKFFDEKIKSLFKIGDSIEVSAFKDKFNQLFINKRKNSEDHINDFINQDLIISNQLFPEFLNHIFEVELIRVTRKKKTKYKIISFDSPKFKTKVSRNSFRDKLDEKLGVDDKKVLLSVSDKLLKSLVS